MQKLTNRRWKSSTELIQFLLMRKLSLFSSSQKPLPPPLWVEQVLVPLALVQVLTIPWVLHPVELLLHLVEEIEEIVSQSNLATAGGRGTRPGVQGGRGPQTGGPLLTLTLVTSLVKPVVPVLKLPVDLPLVVTSLVLDRSPGTQLPGRPTSGGPSVGAGPGAGPGTVGGRPGAGGGPSVGAGPGSPGTVAPSRPTSGGEVPPFDVNDFLPGGSQFGGQVVRQDKIVQLITSSTYMAAEQVHI